MSQGSKLAFCGPFIITLSVPLVYYGVLTNKALLSWLGVGVSFLVALFFSRYQPSSRFPLFPEENPSGSSRSRWVVLPGWLKARPFDLAFLFLLIGALTGLFSSPDFSLSLRAFQTFIACLALYCFFSAYPHTKGLLKGMYLGGVVITLLYAGFFGLGQGLPPYLEGSWVAALSERLSLPPPPDWLIGQSSLLASHGLWLALAMFTAISLGLALFGPGLRLKIPAALLAIFLGYPCFLLSRLSVLRLFAGESLRGRIPLWLTTLDALKEKPLQGLGLGCWATRFNVGQGEAASWGITHPHNAYIELWSDLGIPGLIGIFLFLAAFIYVGLKILPAKRGALYGAGLGLVLAVLISLVVGLVDTAPFGTAVVGRHLYSFVLTPALFLLAGCLTAVKRELEGTHSP